MMWHVDPLESVMLAIWLYDWTTNSQLQADFYEVKSTCLDLLINKICKV